MAQEPPVGLPDTRLGRRLRERRDRVLALAEQYGATNVRVFGSVARGEDVETSDVDLLFDRPPGMGLVGLLGLEAAIEAVLEVDVDLVPAEGLNAHQRDRVLREAIPL